MANAAHNFKPQPNAQAVCEERMEPPPPLSSNRKEPSCAVNGRKKRKSPFRIRRGSLVVARHPVVPDPWIPVWVTPPATVRRDWTLVGSSVRCQVQKKNASIGSKHYLQGVIVKVIPNSSYVELLLDDEDKALGLDRVDPVVNPKERTSLSISEQRRLEFEKRIQGTNTAVVKVALSIGDWALLTHVEKNWESKELLDLLKQEEEEEQQQQHCGEETKSKTTTAKRNKVKTFFIGDRHDNDTQQTNNWRFLAARFPRIWNIGQVVSIDTTQKTTKENNTLALVTVRPLLWPEQTKDGRQVFHRNNEAFVDADCQGKLKQYGIESLIQVAKNVVSTFDAMQCETDNDDLVLATLQYSHNYNLFAPVGTVIDPKQPHCHRCRIQGTDLQQCGSSNSEQQWWCTSCFTFLGLGSGNNSLPCCSDSTANRCDCRQCQEQQEISAQFAWRAQMMAYPDGHSALQSIQTPVNFRLPSNFLEPWPLPSKKPCTKLILPTNRTKDTDSSRIQRTRAKRKRTEDTTMDEPQPQEDYSVFRPTCARLDAPKQKSHRRSNPSSSSSSATTNDEKSRNARCLRTNRLLTELPPTLINQSKRAMRWNLRRLEQVVGKTNTLASKESFLRFGRSNIHAWGVFAEKPIEAEELIIEYRGELISNAVAERREAEYARSLGRDYMFRIDAEQVCDATKQGNVARFINASCEPNCYTKIITFEGAKRIGIYAKRNISEGEELCYDYKFEPEFDPSKRIPCNCMAKDCRGFMNWDRRYVAVPNDVTPDDTSLDQSFEGGGDDAGAFPEIRLTSSAKYASPKAQPPSPRGTHNS